MSNERIDEFLSWRGRLDDPDTVAGQGLDDREATWERLMDKFREMPRRRRFSGFWIAAACLALVFVPMFHFFQDRHVPVIAIRPAVPKPVGKPAASQGASRAVSHEASQVVALEAERHRPVMKGPVTAQRRTAPAVLAELSAAPMVVAAPPLDTVMKKPSITTLKIKQLRIVHINELQGGSASEPAVTAAGSSRHFDIYLQPSLNRTALPPPPPAADPVLLKVKLSSPN